MDTGNRDRSAHSDIFIVLPAQNQVLTGSLIIKRGNVELVSIPLITGMRLYRSVWDDLLSGWRLASCEPAH
ncbi:MAG: hypothetical protein CV087_20255 [Candidatus Brocadia sp. WS118]|nr:MAG: hypothetical protein CV087_20255 [Candidatus Brocadia sp. WS118]